MAKYNKKYNKYKNNNKNVKRRKTLLQWLYGVGNYLDFSIYYKPKKKSPPDRIKYYHPRLNEKERRVIRDEKQRAESWQEKHNRPGDLWYVDYQKSQHLNNNKSLQSSYRGDLIYEKIKEERNARNQVLEKLFPSNYKSWDVRFDEKFGVTKEKNTENLISDNRDKLREVWSERRERLYNLWNDRRK